MQLVVRDCGAKMWRQKTPGCGRKCGASRVELRALNHPATMALLPRIVRAESLALPLRRVSCLSVHRAAGASRFYATHSSLGGASSKSSTSRRQVTVANDDGHVRWGDLTTGEKVARSTQQSFNFLVIVAGVLATVRRESIIVEACLTVAGRRWLRHLHRSPLSRRHYKPISPSPEEDQGGSEMRRTTW